MMMRNVARAIKVLDEIQSRGIRIAIDDFGTGYSSMSLMKQFPIDTIKIDRSFVRDLPDDTEDRAIAQAIINMGHALGMTIVAEGVETVEQETFLRAHGCDEMQGFLFSRPLPSDQMADLLRPAPQMVGRRRRWWRRRCNRWPAAISLRCRRSDQNRGNRKPRTKLQDQPERLPGGNSGSCAATFQAIWPTATTSAPTRSDEAVRRCARASARCSIRRYVASDMR